MLLLLLPLIIKLPFIIGWLDINPLLIHSGLNRFVAPGLLSRYTPYPSIDPNVGFTSQALGRRAALDVLAGQVPWWNPFEGVGTPLAGEMQSAALFPLTWLMAFPDGQLYEHLAFQIIAGLSTYELLLMLKVGRWPAFTGAVVFEFNGVFAWLANAVINPVPFLPMMLLGVEIAADRARGHHPGRGLWISAGLAASLYAGFPEVAYLNGLLAGAWTLLRLFTMPAAAVAWRFAAKIAVSGLAGVAIAAPVLVAFFDFLPQAELAGHAGAGFVNTYLDPGYLALTEVPYLLGGIFNGPVSFWGRVGGYAGCSLLALATAGVFGARQRRLRVLLAAWVAVALGLTFGAPGASFLISSLPGFSIIALYRYLPASWLICLCVLAAMALDDLRTSGRRWPLVVASAALLVSLAASVWVLVEMHLPILSNDIALYSTALEAAFVAAVVSATALPRLAPSCRAAALAAVVMCESLAWFTVPLLSAPRGGAIDHASVQFLKTNLGLGRIATLGPMAPNYGSYFGIAEVNHNDVPVPWAWITYIKRHLDPSADPILFIGSKEFDPSASPPLENFLKHRDAYAAIGVRYLLSPPDISVREDAGLKPVFESSVMRIFELPHPAPYLFAPGCTLDVTSRESVVAECAAPSELRRLELAMPGWTATINGGKVPIRQTAEIFQAVPLGSGRSTIRFSFVPPFMGWAYVTAIIGIMLTFADTFFRRFCRRDQPFSFDEGRRRTE
ncbi:MAG: hypothetical protein JO110_26510 [Acetobacteraceae bacterium]|nr:hypothetical protein [Acetobacteraceae bacterium]